MLNWFEKSAPIRMKFRVLLALHAVFAGLSLAAVWIGSSDPMLIAMAGFGFVATIVTVMIAGSRICTPYVNTVLRMEALATGDIASPIRYTDHSDCVGRMTKAMATFRDNAEALQNSSRTQEALIVKALGTGLKQLSQNDLACELKDAFPGVYDELRKDFNAAVGSLGATVRSVRASALSVHNGAGEIRSASDDLAQRNERQAANLEEAAAAMNQVTDNIRLTAIRATEAQNAISATNQEAAAGGEVVARTTQAMGMIEKSAQEIGQIVSVIDAIAFQTNLLALNAGVEAARAGDAGKGFAVVATEVRALAQRSADAAKDIKELITASSRQVGEGVTLVAETGALLEKILGGVGDITGLMTEIAQTATAQSNSLQQINVTVGEMDRMTQQNAAMVEESTAAARSLADEANELTGLVARFVTGDGPVSHAPRAPFQAAPAPRRAPPPPMRAAAFVQGNLAMQSASLADTDDWSEF